MSGPDCEIVCEECYQHYGNICKKDGKRKGFGTSPTHNAFWQFATEEEIRSNPGSSAPLVPYSHFHEYVMLHLFDDIFP